MRLLLLVPLTAAAAGTWFDGDGRAPALPAAPKAPAAVESKAKKPEAPTPDLVAANARVGNAAMRARLSPRDGAFTFSVIGDAEGGRFPWERVFSPGKDAFVSQWRAAQSGADFVLQLGDFVSKGTVRNYRAHVAEVEREARVPFLRTPGNHDRSRPNGDADKGLYDATFGDRDYFFDHGGWRFVSLDSSDRAVTDAQLDWLERALSVPGPKVVYTHVPPKYLRHAKALPQVGALEEEPAEKGGAVHDFFHNWFEEGADRFKSLVETKGVKAVYMGHIHCFFATDVGGVRYVISGGGGSPLYPLPPGYPKKKFAHVLRVRAENGALTETVVPWKGKAFVLPPVVP